MKVFKIIILILVILTVIGELLSGFGEAGVQILSILIPLGLVIFIITWVARRNKNENGKT
jgi:hypothetical protein